MREQQRRPANQRAKSHVSSAWTLLVLHSSYATVRALIQLSFFSSLFFLLERGYIITRILIYDIILV